MPAQPDLTGHVVLVSGANHGIGAATARLLAEHGAAVLLTYLRTEASARYPARYQASRRADGHEVAPPAIAPTTPSPPAAPSARSHPTRSPRPPLTRPSESTPAPAL